MQLVSGRSTNEPPPPHLFSTTTMRETWWRGEEGREGGGEVGEQAGYLCLFPLYSQISDETGKRDVTPIMVCCSAHM